MKNENFSGKRPELATPQFGYPLFFSHAAVVSELGTHMDFVVILVFILTSIVKLLTDA